MKRVLRPLSPLSPARRLVVLKPPDRGPELSPRRPGAAPAHVRETTSVRFGPEDQILKTGMGLGLRDGAPQSVGYGPAAQPQLGICKKCQFLGPSPDLLDRKWPL